MDACVCPIPTALTTIPAQTCKEDLGQIQKIVFSRIGQSFITASNNIITLASWTATFAAANGTKTLITPFLESVVIPSSEPITEGGGDNTTLDGQELVVGETNPIVTAMMRSVDNLIPAAMRTLRCENLQVYLINEWGKIIGKTVDAGVTVIGIPIHAFWVGSTDNQGKNTQDKTPFRFGFAANWRDTIHIATPVGFDAKTELVPA
jgi:hypothetical protein